MIATSKEEGKWSEKMVEGNDDLRTIESLRGRLLAERQASRAANEEAEQFGSKLVELENQLKEETKMRKKAEKKLNFLKKKLEYLKILPFLEESEQSSTTSSDICSHSCRSSTITTISSPKNSSEESESKSQITLENLDCNVSDSPTSKQSHQSSSIQENSDFLETSNSSLKDLPHEKPSSTSQDSNTHDNPSYYYTSSSMKTSIEENQSEEEDYVDNSLALVPVSYQEESQKYTSELQIMSASVGDVLDALRHAREKIQSSMERRRHMIRVGPC